MVETPTASRRPHILVVDDDEIARTMMEALIEDGDMVVTSLASPLGATRLILEHDIRVIVSDVNIPTMNGSALVDLFRKNPKTKHVQVILVSGMDSDELALVAQQAKPAAYVTKKALLTDLMPVIRRLVVTSQKAEPAAPTRSTKAVEHATRAAALASKAVSASASNSEPTPSPGRMSIAASR